MPGCSSRQAFPQPRHLGINAVRRQDKSTSQQLLEQNDLATTMFHTHILQQGGQGEPPGRPRCLSFLLGLIGIETGRAARQRRRHWPLALRGREAISLRPFWKFLSGFALGGLRRKATAFGERASRQLLLEPMIRERIVPAQPRDRCVNDNLNKLRSQASHEQFVGLETNAVCNFANCIDHGNGLADKLLLRHLVPEDQTEYCSLYSKESLGRRNRPSVEGRCLGHDWTPLRLTKGLEAAILRPRLREKFGGPRQRANRATLRNGLARFPSSAAG